MSNQKNDQEKYLSDEFYKKTQGKRLLTTKETAEYLRVKTQTLANWRHNRVKLNYVKIGRIPMYEKSELDRFINDNRVVLDA